MNRHVLQRAGVTLSREKPASKRSIAKDYHRNLRRIDEPDEVRKVAGCPKCPAWFESVEMRNEHRKVEHGPGSLLVEKDARVAALIQDATAAFMARAEAAGEEAIKKDFDAMLYGNEVLGTVR